MIICTPKNAEKQDWLMLWADYKSVFNAPTDKKLAEVTWSRFFEHSEELHIIAAYSEDKQMIGFACYLFRRSTASNHYYCFLEDLFVTANYREKGVATALIEKLTDIAREKPCDRIYWCTLANNHIAEAFYNKIAKQSDFLNYHITI